MLLDINLMPLVDSLYYELIFEKINKVRFEIHEGKEFCLLGYNAV
jgi:hypothetical protein